MEDFDFETFVQIFKAIILFYQTIETIIEIKNKSSKRKRLFQRLKKNRQTHLK